ncbi:MAG: phospholipid scramblase-related protein [Acidimicrobiia bacterium]
MSDNSTPANWYPDPAGRHEYRYWDGVQWTDHVSDGGVQSAEPLEPDFGDKVDSTFGLGDAPSRPDVVKMVTGDGVRGAGIKQNIADGDGTLWGEPILVVSQKVKLIEVNNQYGVFNQHGKQIAAVNQVGQSSVKKAMRVLTGWDQFMTHKLEIADSEGQIRLRLTRPAKVFKSTVVVEDANSSEIGRIVQQNVFGKIRFSLEAGGQALGSINAENWRAWNFAIRDANDVEIARITKTWEGLMKTMFTTADNYVVQIHESIPQPLLSLVVASALTVDTALKQDARGLN